MQAEASLIGRIVRDLELRKTKSDKSYVRFSLACDVGYGENKQTSFIECVAWNKTAENLCLYQEKGNLIAVKGNIITGSYEKEGKKVYTTEIFVDNILYLSNKGSKHEQNDFSGINTSKNENELKNDASEYFLTDDDLPF